jgi:hypothetical protein
VGNSLSGGKKSEKVDAEGFVLGRSADAGFVYRAFLRLLYMRRGVIFQSHYLQQKTLCQKLYLRISSGRLINGDIKRERQFEQRLYAAR